MCGICGILDFSNEQIIKEDTLQKMCSAMIHRGPDDQGIYLKRFSGQGLDIKAGLAHRRLSIIDLTSAGHQPMPNEDKTVWIVLNGEIYNYRDLRVDLEERGHKFKSQADTETVIHLYEEYGEECVKYLRGMFAFAIWDERKKSLLLARDRVGKKPLIYSHRGNIFCFASEFSALLASNLIDKEINLGAIDYYLTFGYIPAPLTIYKSVFKLPPAHTLTLKDNIVNIKKYWELDYAHKIKISEEDAAEEVLKLLKEATKIRLYSDVPLGAFLSGGIDSSTVVALMSQLCSNKVKTFSVGFEEEDYNELKYARNIARRFGTDHNEFIIKPKALEILPLLVERYGEPYADSSCIPTYYLAKQTKQYVTVALNGDGGDESFAGYERYLAMLVAEMLRKTPYLVSAFRRILKFIPNSSNYNNKLNRIKRLLEAASLPSKKRYIRWVGIFSDNLKNTLYSGDFIQRLSSDKTPVFTEEYFNQIDTFRSLDSLLNTDVNTYLVDDLLVKVDIVSMANSLEARSPFLDHKFMEFAASLPEKYKLKGFDKKYILKKAIQDMIPHENIYRKKMGFGIPINEWFRKELKSFLIDNLLCGRFLKRGYFNPKSIENLVNDHLNSKYNYGHQLWSLLMLELWHQRFID